MITPLQQALYTKFKHRIHRSERMPLIGIEITENTRLEHAVSIDSIYEVGFKYRCNMIVRNGKHTGVPAQIKHEVMRNYMNYLYGDIRSRLIPLMHEVTSRLNDSDIHDEFTEILGMMEI